MNGHWRSEPHPARTDPGAQITAADVVAMVAQRVELSGVRPVLAGESWDAAMHAADVLLGAMGASLGTPEAPR